jgi:hypothetical protein
MRKAKVKEGSMTTEGWIHGISISNCPVAVFEDGGGYVRIIYPAAPDVEIQFLESPEPVEHECWEQYADRLCG